MQRICSFFHLFSAVKLDYSFTPYWCVNIIHCDKSEDENTHETNQIYMYICIYIYISFTISKRKQTRSYLFRLCYFLSKGNNTIYRIQVKMEMKTKCNWEEEAKMQSNHFHESNLISCKLTSWKMFNFVLIVSCMYLDSPVRHKKNEKTKSNEKNKWDSFWARCVLCAWMYDDVSALWNYDTEQEK